MTSFPMHENLIFCGFINSKHKLYDVRFAVLTVVWLSIQVFGDVTLCHLVSGS